MPRLRGERAARDAVARCRAGRRRAGRAVSTRGFRSGAAVATDSRCAPGAERSAGAGMAGVRLSGGIGGSRRVAGDQFVTYAVFAPRGMVTTMSRGSTGQRGNVVSVMPVQTAGAA